MGMILLPGLTIYGCSRLSLTPSNSEDLCELIYSFKLFATEDTAPVRLIYPSIFVMVAASQFAMSLIGVFAKWTQGIRDKEFLVELRLRNLDHTRRPEKFEPSSVVESGGEQEEDDIGVDEED